MFASFQKTANRRPAEDQPKTNRTPTDKKNICQNISFLVIKRLLLKGAAYTILSKF
jgi:hypothetical protein